MGAICMHCGTEMTIDRRIFRLCNRCARRAKSLVLLFYAFCVVSMPFAVMWGWRLPKAVFYAIAFGIFALLAGIGWYTGRFSRGIERSRVREYVNVLSNSGVDLPMHDDELALEARQ